MLYDSLSAGKLSGKYARFEGRITSVGNFAEAFAGIIGGLLAVLSLRTPFYVQASVAFIAIPAAMMLSEPPVHAIRAPFSIRSIAKIVCDSLHRNKKLKWNTLFSAATGASTLTMAWFAQPYFIRSGLATEWFGVAWAVLNLTVGFAALTAWKLEKNLGTPKTVLLFTIILVSGYLALAFTGSVMGFAILLAFYLARGAATPLLRNYINVITTSDVRATVLSVRNFVIRGLFVVLGPFFGWVTDTYSLSAALLAASILFGILQGASLCYFLRYRTYEPEA
jgi:hypothetical protein